MTPLSGGAARRPARRKTNRLHWWSRDEEDTLRFGEILGRALASPAWIGLRGPLGAGKTRLVQGVARGLDVRAPVRSPSFVLEHRYHGRLLLRHLDLYRLEGASPDLTASWEEEDEGVWMVEWAERVADPPPGAIDIEIAPAPGGRWLRMEWDAWNAPLRNFHYERLEGVRSRWPERREQPAGQS